MTVADRTEGHQARCLPHLLVLRMLASDDAEVPSPWLAMTKVAQATDAILAEAEAAGRSRARRPCSARPVSPSRSTPRLTSAPA